MKHRFWRGALGVLLGGAFVVGTAIAADHNEAPGTKADRIADIDDVYAWHDGAGKIVAIVTFGGVGADPAGPPANYDGDVLYEIHLDNTGDAVADMTIDARFGQNSAGDWGVQFTNIPGGTTGAVSGAVDSVIDAGNGLSAQAGTFDDPFFFDFEGLVDTITTGTVSFDNMRDSFAGKNTHALVIEMDAAAATGAGTTVDIWATTGRK
jgi:hypothetical protein